MSAQTKAPSFFITLISLISLTLLFLATPISPTFAQQAPATTNTATSSTLLPVDATNYNAAKHTNFLGENILGQLIPCEIAGVSFLAGESCVFYDSGGSLLTSTVLPGGGALGTLNTVMTVMYTSKPTSTGLYLAQLGESLGIKNAYAQQAVSGSGEGILRPVVQLWQLSRNLSYGAFIIIFLVVGFMIMFRRKLNPQTVVTIQSALPGLVLGLTLVTFSYFIAALIVDISFILMQVVASIFAQIAPSGTAASDYSELAKNSGVFKIFSSFFLFGSEGGLLQSFSKAFDPNAINSGAGHSLNLIPITGPDINKSLQSIRAGAIGGGASNLIAVIILIALFIQMFRLVWSLLTSYIAILAATVLGPLVIAFASIPGRGGILVTWWKSLLANILVFPAVFAAFLFAGVILGSQSDFKQTLPLFAGINPQILKFLIGYGIIMYTPSIPGHVKNLLGVNNSQVAIQAVAVATNSDKMRFETVTGLRQVSQYWQRLTQGKPRPVGEPSARTGR
jgi:hypothetical protein